MGCSPRHTLREIKQRGRGRWNVLTTPCLSFGYWWSFGSLNGGGDFEVEGGHYGACRRAVSCELIDPGQRYGECQMMVYCCQHLSTMMGRRMRGTTTNDASARSLSRLSDAYRPLNKSVTPHQQDLPNIMHCPSTKSYAASN